jgi:hypothetical protein
MGGECGTHGERVKMCRLFYFKNLDERGPFENVGMCSIIVLK